MAKGGNAGLIAFVVVVALLALAALAVGLAALINPNLVADLYGGSSSSSDSSSSSADSGSSMVVNVGSSSSAAVSSSKTYTIAMGNSWGANDFIGSDGRVQGFSRDYVNAVCSAGGLSCRTVVDKYTGCWQDGFGGVGIFAEYYDGCVGWLQTADKLDVFDFSDAYLQQAEVYFYVKPGNSFDPSDMEGKTIGFRDGWTTSPTCVGIQDSISNNQLEDSQIVTVDSNSDLVNLVLNDQVDAIFCDLPTLNTYVEDGTIETVQPSYTCAISGNAVMAKKTDAGSVFLAEFNAAFKKLRESGEFQQLCETANELYSEQGSILCV